jgi:hypothetical protein
MHEDAEAQERFRGRVKRYTERLAQYLALPADQRWQQRRPRLQKGWHGPKPRLRSIRPWVCLFCGYRRCTTWGQFMQHAIYRQIQHSRRDRSHGKRQWPCWITGEMYEVLGPIPPHRALVRCDE